ncbi:O-antigen ligase family protein [Vagococcus carniphilus]|uniref:O-antigen ligase family protein n=1 Tax=Vagococcus carniphilus TaxID=218144 RepID=UPI00288FF6A6|nr:O-antigen ligase family protein [Vagococcus carniphilus]MDT2848676.1 O-antigen ligase family protein [Vagococcus carniphilus]
MEKEIKKSSVFIKSFIFLSICFTYGTTYRGSIYNLLFLGTALLTIMECVSVATSFKISKNVIKIFTVTSLPIVINFVAGLQIDIFDRSRHNNFLILSMVIIFSINLFVKYLFKNTSEIKYVFLTSAIIWTSINWMAFILSKFKIYFFYTGSFSGIFINRNDFAVSSVVLLCLLYITLDGFYNEKSKLIVKVTICSLLLLILLSLSMKGLIGIIFIFVSYRLIIKRNGLDKKILFLYGGLAGIIVIFVIGNMLNSPLILRVEMYINSFLGNIDSYENSNERISLINQGIELAKQNMLYGIGMDNSRYFLSVMYASGREFGKYSHNNYLEVLLNGGIITFLCYYLPIFKIYIVSIFKIKQKNAFKFLFILLSMKLFFDSASVTYTNASVVFIYIFSIAIYVNYKKRGDLSFE